MKAAVVTQDHQVDVTERAAPSPSLHGEALLKMECCGACHTDLHVKTEISVTKPASFWDTEGIGVTWRKSVTGVTSL